MKISAVVFLLLLVSFAEGKQKDAKAAKGPANAVEKRTSATIPTVDAKKADTQVTPAAPAAPATLVMGTVEQWRTLAEERFPDLKTPASEFSVAFDNAYKVTQEENPRFLRANDWPVRLAQLVARQLKEGQPASLAAVRR